MRERLSRTDAIIIRRGVLGEADRLLTILTPTGKRRVVARGARKITSRIAGHIELFNHVHLQLAEGRSLDIVTQSSIIDGFVRLRTDLAGIGGAYYIAELIDRLSELDVDDPALFRVVRDALRAIDRGAAIGVTLRWYELHALERLGYRPELHHCVRCGVLLDERACQLDPGAGGMCCPACAMHVAGGLTLSLACFKVLRFLQAQPIDQALVPRVSAATGTEAERVMSLILQQLLSRDLASRAFLAEANRGPAGQPVADTREWRRGTDNGVHRHTSESW
jgi:DNA repair protein RecO (recombination protein O)